MSQVQSLSEPVNSPGNHTIFSVYAGLKSIEELNALLYVLRYGFRCSYVEKALKLYVFNMQIFLERFFPPATHQNLK